MSIDELMGVVSRLGTATDALAAIGAQLSLAEAGPAADPRVASALAGVSTAAGLSDVDDLAPPQRTMALGVIRMFLHQAADLLGDPARPPGWSYTDPAVLEGIGRGSGVMPNLIAGALPDLAVTSFLDVGVGVGWLAIGAANLWPDATVVGIDVWEPALERAKANVAGAGLDGRISLRNQDITALHDTDTYDCAWVPSFFLSEDALMVGLPKVVNALRPGGTVVLGRFDPVPDPLAQATSTLRTIRGGGCDVTIESACERLAAAGCTEVRPLARTWPMPVAFVIGQKAATAA